MYICEKLYRSDEMRKSSKCTWNENVACILFEIWVPLKTQVTSKAHLFENPAGKKQEVIITRVNTMCTDKLGLVVTMCCCCEG